MVITISCSCKVCEGWMLGQLLDVLNCDSFGHRFSDSDMGVVLLVCDVWVC